MKKLLTLFALLALFSCKSKKIEAAKEKEQSSLEKVAELDSLVRVNLRELEEIKTSSLLENSKFELQTIVDSAGNVPELQYTHQVNGKVVEQINVKGGKLLREQKREKREDSKRKFRESEKEAFVGAKNNLIEKKEKKIKTKQTDVKTTGGTFGTYASIIIIVIVLVVLAFIGWRLKLF